MKLARKYGVSKAPTKYKIISADESFHGRTFDTLAATGHDYYHVGYGPLSPGHVLVPYGDIKALEAQMDDDVCAVLLEPIQGEGGVHVPPAEYLQQVPLGPRLPLRPPRRSPRPATTTGSPPLYRYSCWDWHFLVPHIAAEVPIFQKCAVIDFSSIC